MLVSNHIEPTVIPLGAPLWTGIVLPELVSTYSLVATQLLVFIAPKYSALDAPGVEKDTT